MTPIIVTILYLTIMIAAILFSAFICSFQEDERYRENCVLIGLVLSILWPIGLITAVVVAIADGLICFTHYLHSRNSNE